MLSIFMLVTLVTDKSERPLINEMRGSVTMAPNKALLPSSNLEGTVKSLSMLMFIKRRFCSKKTAVVSPRASGLIRYPRVKVSNVYLRVQ